jgi:hypothetical protein
LFRYIKGVWYMLKSSLVVVYTVCTLRLIIRELYSHKAYLKQRKGSLATIRSKDHFYSKTAAKTYPCFSPEILEFAASSEQSSDSSTAVASTTPLCTGYALLFGMSRANQAIYVVLKEASVTERTILVNCPLFQAFVVYAESVPRLGSALSRTKAAQTGGQGEYASRRHVDFEVISNVNVALNVGIP